MERINKSSLKLFLSFLLLLSSAALFAQTEAAGDSLYVVTYTIGTGWDINRQPQDQLWFKEHSANMNKMRTDGIIKFGGRYADKGVFIFSASSFQNAKDVINADQGVRNKLFNADVQRFNVVYGGCVEKPKKNK